MSAMSKKLSSLRKQIGTPTRVPKGGSPQHTSLISDPAESRAMRDAFENVFRTNIYGQSKNKKKKAKRKPLNLKKAKHGGTLRGVGQALKGFGNAKYSNKLF